MNSFYEHHEHSIHWHYRCFDRILLNGLIQPFQQPERVVGFFNTYRPKLEGDRLTFDVDVLEGTSRAATDRLRCSSTASALAVFTRGLLPRPSGRDRRKSLRSSASHGAMVL